MADLQDVAVVMALYNGAPWIERTLGYIRAQSHAPREIVIVDDGSGDDGPEIVRAVPGVTLLRSPGKGPNEARRHGIAHTAAPLVAVLDQDDAWHAEHLRLLATALERHPDAPAAAAGVRLFERDEDLAFDAPSIDAERRDPWAWFPASMLHSPSGVVMRRSALDAVGGWTTAFSGAGDFYMWLRLGTAGPFVFNRPVTYGWRQDPRSHSAQLRGGRAAEYLGYLLAAADDATAHYVRAHPDERAHRERQRAAGHALEDVVLGWIAGDAARLQAGARALDANTAGESDAYFDDVWTTLFWYAGPALPAFAGGERAAWRFLLDTWPRDARTRWPFVRGKAAAPLPVRELAVRALRRPADAEAWTLAARAAIGRTRRRVQG